MGTRAGKIGMKRTDTNQATSNTWAEQLLLRLLPQTCCPPLSFSQLLLRLAAFTLLAAIHIRVVIVGRVRGIVVRSLRGEGDGIALEIR